MYDKLIEHIKLILTVYLNTREFFKVIAQSKIFPNNLDLRGILHFINENTIIRLAAALEVNGVKTEWKNPKGMIPNYNYKDAASIGTIFLFRNSIMHNGGKLKFKKNVLNKKYYEEFCVNHPEAKKNEGETLCLAIDSVILPLIKGCLDFINKIVIP